MQKADPVLDALPGYRLGEPIYESRTSLVYRALRNEDDRPFIVKALRAEQATPADRARYRHEFEMTRALDLPGVVRASGIEEHRGAVFLLFEDFGAESLDRLLLRGPVTLERFLPLAIDVARALEAIHAEGILHKNLNPGNIVADLSSGRLGLIDFGVANRLRRERVDLTAPGQVEGTLAYLAPEQTGRMNRAVDARSDLYSLGVSFYQLLTGRLPFTATDPLELVHCHMARTPPSVEELRPEIPGLVSDIVAKLMAKSAEDRYQSAAGVAADLETCRSRLEDGGDPRGLRFFLGRHDSPHTLHVSQRLYGRDGELARLLRAFERARGGTVEVMLVAGEPGVGKSALVHELQGPMTEARGYFLAGKCEQLADDTPYSAFRKAFDAFCRYLLFEDPGTLASWREKLRHVVGDLGQVLIDVVPDLELLIGAQPAAEEVGPEETKNRFHQLFVGLVNAICGESHPVVLFLDDLHWVDPGSLDLVEAIVTGPEAGHLLVVGAYRANEVGAGHPLLRTLEKLGEAGAVVDTVEPGNLRREDVDQLVGDSLLCSRLEGRRLGELLWHKTHGNAFFTHQLFRQLYAEGLLRFDSQKHRWTWELEEIEALAVTDNVVELLAKRIASQSERSRAVLQTAACIGSYFDLHTLAITCELTEAEALSVVRRAVWDGLLLPLDRQYLEPETAGRAGFKFPHDRVQQAAYSLLDAEERTVRHLEIGRLLLADASRTELDDQLFAVAGQLNKGADLIAEGADRLELARLNLEAGRKAKRSAAFSAAAAYFEQSVALLGGHGWQEQYDLALQAHDELIEACHLTVRKDEVEKQFSTILEQVRSRVDATAAYRTLIRSRITENRFEEAISLAEEHLARLGVTFEEARPDVSADQLRRLPALDDRVQLAATDILMAMTNAVLGSAPERLPSLAYTMLKIISEHGNSSHSSFAVTRYAMDLCFTGDYEQGARYGDLAVELLDSFPSHGMTAKVMDQLTSWVRHWRSSVHELTAPLERYHEIAMREGDFDEALYCLANRALLLWGSGQPLDLVLSEAEASIELCEIKQQRQTMLFLVPVAEAARNLTGASANTTRLEGRWSSEDHMRSELEGSPIHLSVYGLVKTTLCYLFGEHAEAYRLLGETLDYRASLGSHYLQSKLSLFGALSCAASFETTVSRSEEKERLERLEILEGELGLWAQAAPMNHRQEYDLVRAERFRVTGDPWQAVRRYQQAIRAARENGFVHEEALAHELFGRFWLEQGNESFAGVCLAEARRAYGRWGATAKVRDLEARYSHLLAGADDEAAGRAAPSPGLSRPGLSRPGLSRPGLSRPGLSRPGLSRPGLSRPGLSRPVGSSLQAAELLDLETVLKASQTLSLETAADELLRRMMRIGMENAGATRGVLILKRGDRWVVEAEADTETGRTRVVPSVEIEERDELPQRLIRYVARSRESLLLSDAANEGELTTDPAIRKSGVRSVLCLPLVHQERVHGVLYLENRLVGDAFAQERVELLQLLSSQMAMALSNARLLGDLRGSEERFRSLVEQSPMAIQIATPEGRIRQVNAAWRRLWGLDEDQAAEVTARIDIRDDEQSRELGIAPLIEKAFAGEPVVLPPLKYDVNATLERLGLEGIDGRAPWIQCHLYPVKDAAGEIAYVVTTYMDITELRRAEQEAREQREALARIDRAASLGQLTGSIAHELNQPLTGILSNAQAAELMIESGRWESDELAEVMAQIVTDTKRAGDVIHSLHELYREQKVELLPVDLNATVEETTRLLHSEFVSQHIVVTTERSPSIPWVKGNAIQLQQVLVNLVLNGIQAMRESPPGDRRLRIATAHERDEVKVWVEDNGPGIDPAHLDRIFEPLATWKPGGTGMGLAISHSIVEAHHGRMWAENLPEGGARVGFTVSTTTVE